MPAQAQCARDDLSPRIIYAYYHFLTHESKVDRDRLGLTVQDPHPGPLRLWYFITARARSDSAGGGIG